MAMPSNPPALTKKIGIAITNEIRIIIPFATSVYATLTRPASIVYKIINIAAIIVPV